MSHNKMIDRIMMNTCPWCDDCNKTQKIGDGKVNIKGDS